MSKRKTYKTGYGATDIAAEWPSAVQEAPDYAGHSGAHTWTYEVEEASDGYVYSVYDERGRRLTEPYISEANAHLIAAAPELLAACHDAAAMLGHLGVIGSLPDELNAAIAKAEGQP